MEENTKGVTFMKKSLLLVSLSLSLLIALSGCNKDVKVSEIDVENKPVSRSIAVEPTAEEDTPVSLTQAQKKLLERWSRLSEEQQAVVFALIDKM